jgi:hypothetical protein
MGQMFSPQGQSGDKRPYWQSQGQSCSHYSKTVPMSNIHSLCSEDLNPLKGKNWLIN